MSFDQNGPDFPGFGFFDDNFGGTIPAPFGFPDAGTPGLQIPGDFPDLPFWEWNSGYPPIHIRITFHRARVLQFVVFLDDGDFTDGFGNSNWSYNLTLNGHPILSDSISTGAGDYSTNSHGSPYNGVQTYKFYLITNDARPNKDNSDDTYPAANFFFDVPPFPKYRVVTVAPKVFMKTNNVLQVSSSLVSNPGGGSGAYGVQAFRARRFSALNQNKWHWFFEDNGSGGISLPPGPNGGNSNSNSQVPLIWSFTN